MTLLVRRKQIHPRQYGWGLRVYRHRGDGMIGSGIYDSFKRYAFPVGKYLYRKVLRPFVRNNRTELKNILSKHSLNIIKNLAENQKIRKPDAAQLRQEVGEM